MVDEKDIKTPKEESNIDQINNFVTNSESNDMIEEPSEQVVEIEEESMPVAAPVISKERKPLVKTMLRNNVVTKNEVVSKVDSKSDSKNISKLDKRLEHKEQLKEKSKEQQKEQPKKLDLTPVAKVQNKIPNHKKIEKKGSEENHEKNTNAEKQIVKTKKIVKQEPKIIKNHLKNSKSIIITKPLVEDKMKKEKNTNKNHKSKSKSNKHILMWVGIGVLAVILIAALAIFGPTLLSLNQSSVAKNETKNTVAATVNGETIYLQSVLSEYNKLNPALKTVYSVESILNKSIDELLLSQEAKSRGIVIKSEDVQREIDAIKIQNQLTDTELETALKQQNMTLKDLESTIEKNLKIRALLNETILKDLVITKEQVSTYYKDNLAKYAVPEKVTVQHILVAVTSNVTESQAKDKIDKINKELTKTNFCDLVTNYTDDTASIATCGTYTFAKGDFNNPEFENPSFDLKVGETTIVKTMFGYHLIKKLETIPARTMNLSEVSKDIETTLHDETAQKRFDVFIKELQQKAVIVNYLTKIDSNETTLTTISNLDEFAKCLTTNNAKFYGAYWCAHCNNQKKLFGDSLKYVQYVECAVEGQPQVQTEECTKAGISGYPTWVINGKSYPGEQTLDSLAKLTGCTVPK